MKKFIALFLCAFVLTAYGTGFTVVKNGKAAAGIEIRTDNADCREAAKIIRKYVKLVSGAELENAKNAPKIVLKIEKGKQDIEGFTYTFPKKDVMEITAGGNWGIRYAAADFCERFLGVRFLYAGPHGDYLPQKKDIVIPAKKLCDAPKYLTRCVTNGRIHHTRKVYQDWATLMRGVEPYRVNCHHNLSNMFSSKIYGKTHPEFYPLLDGKRYIPPAHSHVHWQPCLTAPGIVDEAVKIVCRAFEKNPELICYPLGVTDGNGYCECENCKKFYPANGRKNSTGQPDRTKYFVTFYNKVAEKVVKKFPNAKMGFLAYSSCQDAPGDMKLHPALIPSLTYDRFSWVDPERRKAYLERDKKWSRISSEMMWYDYFYNNRYVLPRIYPHLTADIIKTGYKQGVRHIFAEYFTIDGTELGKLRCDGPSAYIAFKLLWNPELDVDALLDEWYTCAVGKKAAPYLKKYFAELENFWMTKAWKTKWFTNHYYKIYLQWNDNSYVSAIEPAMLERCKAYLDKMCALADHKQRAEYLREGFLARKGQLEYQMNTENFKKLPESAFDKIVYKTDFETPESRKGWYMWQHRQSINKAEIVPAGKMGMACRLTMHPRTSEVGLERVLKIDNPKDMLFKVRFRCEKVSPEAYPYISVEWCPEADTHGTNLIYYAQAAGNRSENGWILTCRLQAYPQKTGYLRIRLRGARNTKGYIYFDDLEVRSR